MGSRYSDMTQKQRRERIAELRDNAWYRSRGKAALTEKEKTRIQEEVRAAARRHNIYLYDHGAWTRLVDRALPYVYNPATERAGLEYAKSIAARTVGRKGMPVKRQLKSAMAALRAQGVSSRRAAELLYAASQESSFDPNVEEDAEYPLPECETCNKKHGGYHFHTWDACPNNPLND